MVLGALVFLVTGSRDSKSSPSADAAQKIALEPVAHVPQPAESVLPIAEAESKPEAAAAARVGFSDGACDRTPE